MKEISRLLSALFDFSFTELVTPRVIKFLYGLGMLASLFFVTIQVANAFLISDGRGVWALFFAPFLFLFYLLTIRVSLETLGAVFSAVRKGVDEQETVTRAKTVKIGVGVAEEKHAAEA